MFTAQMPMPNENMLSEELAASLAVMSKDAALVLWQNVKAQSAKMADFEKALRQHNIDIRFDALRESGINNLDLGNGYTLKATTSLTYKLASNDEVEAALLKLEKDPEGAFIAKRLIGWTPKIGVAEYKLLSPKHKAIIDKVLTISESAVTLKIDEPKAKK